MCGWLLWWVAGCSADGRLVGTWGVETVAVADGLDGATQAKVAEGVERTLRTIQIELGAGGKATVRLGAARAEGRYVVHGAGDRLVVELTLGHHVHHLPMLVLGDRLQVVAPDGQPLILSRRSSDPDR